MERDIKPENAMLVLARNFLREWALHTTPEFERAARALATEWEPKREPRSAEATPPAEGPIRCECKVIHDRVTSKHVQTGLDENGEDGTPKTCALLNELATRRESPIPMAHEATTCPCCEAAGDLNVACVKYEREIDLLREALGGLVDNIRMHRSGECPGITPADCLDAIYESAEVAAASLSSPDPKEGSGSP